VVAILGFKQESLVGLFPLFFCLFLTVGVISDLPACFQTKRKGNRKKKKRSREGGRSRGKTQRKEGEERERVNR